MHWLRVRHGGHKELNEHYEMHGNYSQWLHPGDVNNGSG